MENWETGGNPIKAKHFEFPRGFWRFMDSEGIAATRFRLQIDEESAPGPCAGSLAKQHRPEPITRRYRPEPAALDALVEVLYQLVVDATAGDSALASAVSESTCFSRAHE